MTSPLDVALGESSQVVQALLARIIQLALENVQLREAVAKKDAPKEETKTQEQ